VEPAHCQEAEGEEEREHGELRDGERRLGLGRRQQLQEGDGRAFRARLPSDPSFNPGAGFRDSAAAFCQA
jgi:hypothetical protein